MSKQDFFRSLSPGMDIKSSLLFLVVGVIIISITFWNWHYDIRPRLVNEAESNARVLASSHARCIRHS